MSDASVGSASNNNWIQQAQNNPVDFLKSLDDLLDDFGSQQVGNAVTQQYITKFVDALREQIADSDLPQGIKDAATAVLDAHSSNVAKECPCSAEAAEAVSNSSESAAIDQSAEAAAESAAEAANEGTATQTSSSESDSADSTPDIDVLDDAVNNEVEDKNKKKPGNWLEALAMMLSEVQSEFLDKAMDAAETMRQESGNTSGSDTKSEKFLEAQGLFSANNQLFTIFSNQTSTSIKTIGEALAGISRKQ